MGPEGSLNLQDWLISFCPYSDHFPYFKAEDDRWKNSVRHNLSMNPHFRKGDKSKHGAGHLWVLADYDSEVEKAGGVDHSIGGGKFTLKFFYVHGTDFPCVICKLHNYDIS